MSEPTSSDAYGADSAPVQLERRRWSRLGLASLVIGIVNGVALVAVMGVGMAWQWVDSPGSGQLAQTRVLLFAVCTGSMVGIGLAIAGLLQPNRTRGPSVIGLVFNIGVLFIFAIALAIGLWAEL